MTAIDQTDLAYFALALHTTADELHSAVLHALAQDFSAIKRRLEQQDAEIAALYGFLDELTALTPVNPRLGKDAANLALDEVGRRIRARLGTK